MMLMEESNRGTVRNDVQFEVLLSDRIRAVAARREAARIARESGTEVRESQAA